MTIQLSNGGVALIDDEDVPLLARFRWNLSLNGYAVASVGGRKNRCTKYMHREVMGLTTRDGLIIDHINGNKLDNRKTNLRIATQTLNLRNSKKRKGSTSRFKGVSWNSRIGKWVSQLKSSRHVWLGWHDSEENAARKYDEAARLHFGEFARLNFPKDIEQPAIAA